MGEVGIVINAGDGVALVSITRTEACAKCGACKIAGDKEMVITAKNDCGAVAGDTVLIELADGMFFRASFIMFGVPLLMLVAGISAGAAIGEFAAFILGGVGIFASFLFIKKYEKSNKIKRYSPYIKEIQADKTE